MLNLKLYEIGNAYKANILQSFRAGVILLFGTN